MSALNMHRVRKNEYLYKLAQAQSDRFIIKVQSRQTIWLLSGVNRPLVKNYTSAQIVNPIAEAESMALKE